LLREAADADRVVNQGVSGMRASRGLLVIVVLPLLLAADEKKSPPKGWEVVTPKNKAYVVWFPREGKREESRDSLVARKYGQIRFFRIVQKRKPGYYFATSQIILPPRLTRAPAKVRQNFFRDSFLEEVNGKVVKETKVRLGTMPGKEYLIKTPVGMARLRLLGTGVQIYRIAVVGTKEQLESKDTATFFDSFKRTPRTKAPPKDKK
jgi:hypothetical protein